MSNFFKNKDTSSLFPLSVEASNSALNLATSVSNLQQNANSLFSGNGTNDVVNQNLNIMSGNHYIQGYGGVIIPFPPRIPAVPDPLDFVDSIADKMMGYDQDIRTQPLVDYDMENFKYSMDKQSDHPDYYYEDPLLVSFDLFFDDQNSPLFNGEVDNFFDVYLNRVGKNALDVSRENYNRFKDMFFKIFNKISHQDKKSNKAWYVNSITGLDKLTAKISKYEEDKITITMSEDIAMLVNDMIDSYNNFAYNYRDQRYNLPDNLMRFKILIQFTDLRTMRLLNHFETPQYLYDKATQIYTLYDCNFNFFDSKNFTDEVSIGGYGVAANNTPATVKFDIIYKSIQKEFRTPLIKGQRNTIINNKDYWNLDYQNENSKGGNGIYTSALVANLKRTEVDELTAKELMKGVFGIVSNVGNMIQNIIPKFKPNIPILPPNILGSLYDNTYNFEASGFTRSDITTGDLADPNPLLARKALIDKFITDMNSNPPVYVVKPTLRDGELGSDYQNDGTPIHGDLGYDYQNDGTPIHGDLGYDYQNDGTPIHGDLGYDYKNDGTPVHGDLGYDYKNDGTPTHGDLGYDYKNDGTPTHGDLGYDYKNDGTPTHGDLGYDYKNDGNPVHGDLGYDYKNDGTPVHGDLGSDYINTGNRQELPNIILFGKGVSPVPNLGSIYTNVSELRDINLGTEFDNSVERGPVSLNILYDNIVGKQPVDLGNDFVNISEKQPTELNTLFGPTEKPQTQDMGSVFNPTSKEPTQDMGNVFIGTEKPKIQDMGSVFTGTEKQQTQDMGSVFNPTSKEPTQDMGSVFIGTEKPQTQDMGSVFTGTEKQLTSDMGSVFNNVAGKTEIQLDSVYNNISNENKTIDLNSVYDNINIKSTGLDGEIVFVQPKNIKQEPDLGSDYINISKDKKGLDGESVYENKIKYPVQDDLGESYENNLIEE